MTCLACKRSPQRACFALHQMALDLRSIPSLSPEEEAVLQAMREYIRAASLQKMAKVRMWETENLQLLQQQIKGGGGGGELVAFRTLSQHIKVHRLGPPQPPASPAKPRGGSLIGRARTGAEIKPASPSASPASPRTAGGAGAAGGMLEGNGGVGGVGGGAAAAGGGGDGADGTQPKRTTSMAARATSIAKANVAIFGRPKARVDVAAVGRVGAEVGTAIDEAAWPAGRRLPSGWHGCATPGSLVAALRAHPEGVRQLVRSSDGQWIVSRGSSSSLHLYSSRALIEEFSHSPIARQPLPGQSVTASGVAFCMQDAAVALATSDGTQALQGSASSHVSLLAMERFGAPDALISRFSLSGEQGCLLNLGVLGGGGAGGGGGGGGGLVLYTTESGEACAIDPRSGGAAWRVRCGRPLGLMQAHATDAAGQWLVLGSSTGHCVLWDLRYSLKLKLATWQCPNASRVHTMLAVRPPASTRPTLLLGTDDNLVLGYELGDESPRCTLLLQPETTPDALAFAAAAPVRPPQSVLQPYALTLAATAAGPAAAAAAAAGSASVRALAAPLDGSCVLTASSDTRLRCWQLRAEPSTSFLVGGQPLDTLPTRFEEVRVSQLAGCRVVREVRAYARDTSSVSLGTAGPAKDMAQRPATVGAEDMGCAAAVTSIVYCPAPQAQQAGLLLAGSLDGTVRVWRHVRV